MMRLVSTLLLCVLANATEEERVFATLVPAVPSVWQPLVTLGGHSARYERSKATVDVRLEDGYLLADVDGEADKVYRVTFHHQCGGGAFSINLGAVANLQEDGTATKGLSISFQDDVVSVLYDKAEARRGRVADFCDGRWHTISLGICPHAYGEANVAVFVDAELVVRADLERYAVAGSDLVLAAAHAEHALKDLKVSSDIVAVCSQLTDDAVEENPYAYQPARLHHDRASRIRSFFCGGSILDF